jgi:hypothetical protein
MKAIWMLALAALVSSSAMAADSTQLECKDVKKLIKGAGALELSTAGRRPVRYVSDSSYCFPGEQAVSVGIKTADKNQCMVFICQDRGPGDSLSEPVEGGAPAPTTPTETPSEEPPSEEEPCYWEYSS